MINQNQYGYPVKATYLFRAIDQIREDLRQSAKVLLLLDYDGTLVPIASRPDLALLPESTHTLLKHLKDHPKIILGIVSGRSLEEIKKLVNMGGVFYVGNHGLEMDLLTGPYVFPEGKTFLPQLVKLKDILSRYLPDFPGSLLEDKGLILSIHYRNLALDKIPVLQELIEKTVVAQGEGLMMVWGKKVWEIRPKTACNKGSAVLAILESLPVTEQDILSIYLGDDKTDEDAFLALADKGITIRVGSPSDTIARFYLTEPKETLEFLRFLCQEL